MTEPTPDTPRRPRWRVWPVVLAALVPIVPIVVALFLTTGASRTPRVATTQTAAYTPVAAGSGSDTAKHASAGAKRTSSVLPPGQGAVTGFVSRTLTMRSRPGGGHVVAQLKPRTNFGSPTWVLVTRHAGGWLGVVNTAAGNNQIGWIRDTGVQLSRDRWRIHAELNRHQLLVYHDGREVQHFLIAVGKPTAPTPTGLYAVTDRLTTGDPEGPYGCCILALSAKAPHHISDWDGGNRIAIHSTPETDSIGYSVSHGCMRLSLPAGRWLIHHIPLATPVRISSA